MSVHGQAKYNPPRGLVSSYTFYFYTDGHIVNKTRAVALPFCALMFTDLGHAIQLELDQCTLYMHIGYIVIPSANAHACAEQIGQ